MSTRPLFLWRVCHLTGYDVGVIEMLLMMSGDVEPNPGPVLGPDNLVTVFGELLDVCSDWYNVGLVLRLTVGILKAIRAQFSDPKECLREMLSEWLTKSPNPAWEGLIRALKDPIVGKDALARKLKMKYCTQEPPPGVHTTDVVHRQIKEEFGSLNGLTFQMIVRDYNPRSSRFQQMTNYYYYLLRDVLVPRGLPVAHHWDKLKKHWDYLNYGLLELVVLEFGNESLKQQMESYVHKLDRFKQETNYSDFVYQPSLFSSELKEFTVKWEQPGWPSCTVWQVQEFMHAIMFTFSLPNESLLLYQEAVEGCVCVKCLFGDFVVSAVQNSLLNAPGEAFKKSRIISITLGKHKYYTLKLEEFADYLRDTYEIQVPEYRRLQWPPPPTHKVFNLAMYTDSTTRRQPPGDKDVRLLMRGKVCDVMRGKPSVKLENIFKLDSQKRKVILIEGAPGAGKSTLAWDIIQKWRVSELFQEFTIALFVQLRDPEVQKALSIEVLIPSLPDGNEADVVAEITSCLGCRVLFVLDGWDEYEPGFQNPSLIKTLICSPQNLHLHHSTLLITSRPIASGDVQTHASSRVEIVGFTPEEVNRYFQEALKDPLAVQNLQGQLEERPVIQASCYLPLNAAIVAHLFKELNHVLPTTVHGVFTAVVSGCIRRYLKKHSGKDQEILSLDELPSDIQEEFQSLCTLAFKGSIENKVSFSGRDMKLHRLSAEDNVLDLIQVVQSFASRNSKLCHFLHLSVQELLTALHISRSLSAYEQVESFNGMFDNPRFASVFRFYAAFTKLQTEGIELVIANIAQSGQKDRLLNLMHCLYEAQHPSLCCSVASHLNGKLDLEETRLNPLDFLSLGYFLSCLCGYTSGTFTSVMNLTAYSPSICADTFSLLVKGLTNCPPVQHSDVKVNSHANVMLCLADTTLQARTFDLLFQALTTNISIGMLHLDISGSVDYTDPEGSGPLMLSENRTLKELHLAGHPISDNALGFIARQMRYNTGLVKVSLKGVLCDTEKTGTLLMDMLHANNTLKELELRRHVLGATGLDHVAQGLTRNSELLNLSLHGYEVSECTGSLLKKMLSDNSTLKKLEIAGSVNDAGLRHFVRGLKHNTGLVKLSLRHCSQITEVNGPLLEEMLHENRALKELDISVNAIGAKYIVQGLRYNTGLEKLLLCGGSWCMTEVNRAQLEDMLHDNTTLKELCVAGNKFGVLGLRCIATGLMHNTGLLKLSANHCDLLVNEDNGEAMVNMLSRNKTLQEVDISDNPIGATGLAYIAKGLRHNTGLLKFSLRKYHIEVTRYNGPLLQEMLKRNRTLQQLELEELRGVTTDGFLTIVKGMRESRGLTNLTVLGFDRVHYTGWERFVHSLQKTNVTKLHLRNAKVTLVGRKTEIVNAARRQQGLPPLEVVAVCEA